MSYFEVRTRFPGNTGLARKAKELFFLVFVEGGFKVAETWQAKPLDPHRMTTVRCISDRASKSDVAKHVEIAPPHCFSKPEASGPISKTKQQ